MSKELISARNYRKASSLILAEPLELSPEQRQELNALYQDTARGYKPGNLIVGKIVTVGPQGVQVDIGFKSDGIVPLSEFNEHELKKMTAGSDVEIIIDELENADGAILLSYERAKEQKAWTSLMKLFDEQKPVEGVVTHKVKGGLSVDIGVPAFLPGSQVDVQRVADFDQFVGQTITSYIIKINQRRGNVILSRRKYLSEQRADSRKKILDELSVGSIIQGVVKNITHYGAFVDIGGVDGLLHITDMTWGRIAHPSEIIKIGDTITVQVLTLDKEHEKISLGIKQLQGNPWEQLDESIQIGSRVKGTVSSITDYGLFIALGKGVEGLVHISEISWTDRITDLHKHYHIGDEVEAVIVSLDKENRRMSLSIKQLERNPWEAAADQFQVGQQISGKVSNITDFGVFIQLAPGVDGLVHISDLSWTEHVKHPADIFKRGDTVEAVVLDINRQKKKISLGIKQLTENPWDNIEQKYPIGSTVSGEVTKITDFGAFIKLPSGIEGLVHISELSGNEVEKVSDVLAVGQKAEFKIIKVSQEDHKLGLSLKTDEELAQSARKREEMRNTRLTVKKHTTKARPEQKRKKHTERNDDTPYEMTASASPGRMKSQLQLELEKHSARNESEE